MSKLRIAAVSYLNTKPFIYGLMRSALGAQIDVQLCHPAECARRLKSGEVDLALAPVAIIPELPHAHIVSDYCIGAFGKVGTVTLYSEVHFDQIKAIYLDHHSRTSAALIQLICRDHWNIAPQFLQAQEGFISEIKGDVAGLVIGDRTIGLEKKYPYAYDLAEIWLEMTKLPFVFAAWITVNKLDQEVLDQLNLAFADGLRRIPELIKVLPSISGFDVQAYYEKMISYDLNAAKKEALLRFLGNISDKPLPKLSFTSSMIATEPIAQVKT